MNKIFQEYYLWIPLFKHFSISYFEIHSIKLQANMLKMHISTYVNSVTWKKKMSSACRIENSLFIFYSIEKSTRITQTNCYYRNPPE